MANSITDRMAWCVLTVLALTLKMAPGCSAIECYVCDSSSQIGCAEFLTDTSLLEPQTCDNVYDAKFCVKMTQVFEDGSTVYASAYLPPPVAGAIDCYQCDGISDLYCGERFDADMAARLDIVPRPCSGVHDAAYCVKTTAMFGGQLGTKRFCSARDFGNYCEWVNRPGDPNTYQACVLTCSSDACNAATGSRAASLLVAVATALALVGWVQATR